MNEKVHLGHIETHIVHRCTMRCRRCTHYCDIGYNHKIDDDALINSIVRWSTRITTRSFSILGGEPTLNKRLPEYVHVVAKCFPDALRTVCTNGTLLYKWDDILPKTLARTGTRLLFSIHPVAKEAARQSQIAALELAHNWRRQYGIELLIYNIKPGEWMSQYRGYGLDIRPYEDSAPEKSRALCKTPCVNLLDGKLWKCPPLAYLPFIIDKLTYKEKWNYYLQYTPLDFSASHDALEALAFTRDSAFCGMCPASKMGTSQELQ